MAKVIKNKKIKDELVRLRQIEKHISKLERERSALEVQLVKEAGGPGAAIGKRHARRGLSSYAFTRFRRRKFVYFLITSLGAVLLWVGAWEILERYHINPWFTTLAGVAVIWLTRNYD